MTWYWTIFETPCGPMTAAVDGDGAVGGLNFINDRDFEEILPKGERVRHDERCAHVAAAVTEYFAGRPEAFESLDLAEVGSDFQRRVWAEVRRLGWGETASYGEIAARLGRPGASRAVGRANATNPVSLVTPCHRVIGSDGSLTGYGGGVENKRSLLAMEKGQLELV